MPLVFDDSQNAGGDKGAPPECGFIASSASYLALNYSRLILKVQGSAHEKGLGLEVLMR